jgi:hypothetical protein
VSAAARPTDPAVGGPSRRPPAQPGDGRARRRHTHTEGDAASSEHGERAAGSWRATGYEPTATWLRASSDTRYGGPGARRRAPIRARPWALADLVPPWGSKNAGIPNAESLRTETVYP